MTAFARTFQPLDRPLPVLSASDCRAEDAAEFIFVMYDGF